MINGKIKPKHLVSLDLSATLIMYQTFTTGREGLSDLVAVMFDWPRLVGMYQSSDI